MNHATKCLASRTAAVVAALAVALLLAAALLSLGTAPADASEQVTLDASSSTAAQHFGRVVNNTIIGGSAATADGASPTLLNNIVVN